MSAGAEPIRIPDEVLAEEFYIALHEAYGGLRDRFLRCRDAGG